MVAMVAIMLCGSGSKEEGKFRVSGLTSNSPHTNHKSIPCSIICRAPETSPGDRKLLTFTMPEVSTILGSQTPGPSDLFKGPWGLWVYWGFVPCSPSLAALLSLPDIGA